MASVFVNAAQPGSVAIAAEGDQRQVRSPRDGALFADWMLLRTSAHIARDARTLDAYLGTLLDALACHVQLSSLWDPARRIDGAQPLVLLDGEHAAFAYTVVADRHACLFTPQGAGALVDALPGAQYGVGRILQEVRQHRADLRALLCGIEGELRLKMRYHGTNTYPYKAPLPPGRCDA